MNMTDTHVNQDSFLIQFDRVEERRGDAQPWLKALHSEAFSKFKSLGMPTRKDEEWRFSSPARLAEALYVVGAPEADSALIQDGSLAALVGPTLSTTESPKGMAFLNGRYVPNVAGLCAEVEGAFLGSLAELTTHFNADATNARQIEAHLGQYLKAEDNALSALNTALFEDGVLVYIPRNTVVEQPIEIVFVGINSSNSEALLVAPRVIIIAEANSQATIIETYIGSSTASYFNNAVMEVKVAESAVVDHYKVVKEGVSATHVGQMGVSLERNSNFSSHSITLNGSLVRNEVVARLDGEYAECTLNGLYLGDGDRLIDNHTTIDHAQPNCNSHEIYKGILAERSRGVFNGKIYVRLDAQKTDAKQTNKTLLLSPDARIDTKPQLEILADDVKCTHGATVGQLDPNQVFYLRSRGMSESEARNLLTYAFAGDIVQRIKVEALRTALDKTLLELLPGS